MQDLSTNHWLHFGRRQSDALTAACFAAARRMSREHSAHSLAMMYKDKKHPGNAGGLGRHFDLDYSLPSFRTRSLDDPDVILEESEPSNDSQSPTSPVSPVTCVTQTSVTSPLTPVTPVTQTSLTSPVTAVNQKSSLNKTEHTADNHTVEYKDNNQRLKSKITSPSKNQSNNDTFVESTIVDIGMSVNQGENLTANSMTTYNAGYMGQHKQYPVKLSYEPLITRRPRSLGQELIIPEKLVDDQGGTGNKTPSPTRWSLSGCLTPQDSPKKSPRNLSPRGSPRSEQSFPCISPSITPEGSREELLQVTSL